MLGGALKGSAVELHHRGGPLVEVAIPPLDSLVHDAAYFRAVARSSLHGGLLDGLRDYYLPS